MIIALYKLTFTIPLPYHTIDTILFTDSRDYLTDIILYKLYFRFIRRISTFPSVRLKMFLEDRLTFLEAMRKNERFFSDIGEHIHVYSQNWSSWNFVKKANYSYTVHDWLRLIELSCVQESDIPAIAYL